MSKKETTKIIHAGYDPSDYHGVVNPPIVRASTILYDSLDAYEDPNTRYRYGRYETPSSDAFVTALSELEQGYKAVATPSGLSAITTALFAFLKSGDHVLIVDTLYPPSRHFCDHILVKMGIEVEYYDPLVGAGIEELVKDNTAVIYMETPGSATFEIQDVPAIVKVAKEKGIVTMLDNSWSSGVLFKPLTHGVDISILSCTKYIVGHSDAMLGAAVAGDEKIYRKLKKAALDLGVCAGSEEVNLGYRGLKTLHIRMKEAGARAARIAKWLDARYEVRRVFYPGLENDPNHEMLKKYYSGANGVIGVLFKEAPREAIAAFTQALKYFPIGSSWGGYESLTQPQYLDKCRTAVPWTQKGAFLRFQVGLEDPDDLIADLEQAFEKFGEKA